MALELVNRTGLVKRPQLPGFHRFSMDTETCLLAPGLQAPPLVCLQFKVDGGPAQLIHRTDPALKRVVEYALQRANWNGHNLVYDVAVLMAAFPDLIPLFFDLFDDDGAVCTIVVQKLLDIARGRFKLASTRGYGMDRVAAAHKLSHAVNKEDPYRLTYGELIHTPITLWNEGQLGYALNDVDVQDAVYLAQQEYARSRGVPLADQYRQTRAALWLHLIACRGIRVDPQRCEEYLANVRATLEIDREICAELALVRPDGSRDTTRAQEWMVQLCREAEEDDLPITEAGERQVRAALGLQDKQPIPKAGTWKALELLGGKVGAKGLAICLNEDACKEYGDEVLEAYQRYSTGTTQLARAERLYVAARSGLPIQSRFGSLQDTGRTSCSQGDVKGEKTPSAIGSQLQNPAKDKKVRRKQMAGWVVDPTDPKKFLNPITGETKAIVFTRKGTRELFVPRTGFWFCSTDYGSMEMCGFAQVCIWTVGFSRLAEVLNAGRDPHVELGATLAKISVDEAYARRKGERGEALKAEFDNKYRQLAKIANFGFQGGMGPAKLALSARKQYDVVITVAEAKELREAWLVTWPEARAYFKWVSARLTGPKDNQLGVAEQFKSGRVRAGCWYSAFANTLFQGFCADIAKEAGWTIAREMYARPESPLYGSYQVNFLHDEMFSELVIERAHEAAMRQAQIQIQVAEAWGPDVRWSCEPALSTRWYKSAEAVYNRAGRLIPWEPSQKYEKSDGRLVLAA
jgi:hypothetical protein